MKSIIAKTTVAVGGVILVALAFATAVKSQSVSTAANDAYFEPSAEGETLARTVGRNVTFRDLIAEAYDCGPGQVVLPSDAPEGGFDFLVTASPKTRKHLRDAIEKKLGYVAESETRETEVMALEVKDASLPGLAVSTDEEDDINYRDGKLYFTHQPLSVVIKGLEDGLAVPIVDRTGLTNSYNFSVAWNDDATQAMREGKFHFDGVQKVLNGWGLELKPEQASMELFVVKKVH